MENLIIAIIVDMSFQNIKERNYHLSIRFMKRETMCPKNQISALLVELH